MHAFPLPGLSQILCENNTYIHFVLLCLADAFCFIFQALSGLMFVPSSVFSPHSSPMYHTISPQISEQLPRQTLYRLHKLTFLESERKVWGGGIGISSTYNRKWQPLNRSGQ